MILTYVINLLRATERKEYMASLLKPYDHLLDVRFIEGVDGKSLSAQQVDEAFDKELSFQRYGRKLNPGEIGCTLSHYKCYKSLLESQEEYALILEDDISILRDLNVLDEFTSVLKSNKPIVLFLSGDYWYMNKGRLNEQYSKACVYDAVGTYAYFINKAACKKILQKIDIPSHVADHWSLYRRMGLSLKAIYPYMVDANIVNFESNIEQNFFGEVRKNMSFKFRMQAYWVSLNKKILLKMGHFVSKIRK